MTARRQWMIVLVVVGMLAAGLGLGVHLLGDELFPVSVGSTAPDFHARTVDGPAVVKSLADYRGQVVLLNVWATWCDPCRVEMPAIERLQQRLGSRGLHVVAVSIDDPGQRAAIRTFARTYGLTFEILHDGSGAIEKTYQTTGVPETFIIGRDGVIRKKVIGATDWDSEGNRALIRRLLAERS